jgi:hypothetical protein
MDFLMAKIILGGGWLMLAPALLFPLGTVLFDLKVLRGMIEYLLFLFAAVVFAALGVIFLVTLPLGEAFRVIAGVVAIWWVGAAIMAIAQKAKLGSNASQKCTDARAHFGTGAPEQHAAP